MEWTKTKAVEILMLEGKYTRSYLQGLSDHDLFNIGREDGYWIGDNPFPNERQETLKQQKAESVYKGERTIKEVCY